MNITHRDRRAFSTIVGLERRIALLEKRAKDNEIRASNLERRIFEMYDVFVVTTGFLQRPEGGDYSEKENND